MATRSFARQLRLGIGVLAAVPLAVATIAAALAWLIVRDVLEPTQALWIVAVVLTLAAVLALGGFAYGRRLARSASEPIERIQATLEALADGDLDASVHWRGGSTSSSAAT